MTSSFSSSDSKKPKLQDILKALSDEHSLRLFKLAATELNGGVGAYAKVGLSKKQFYSRLHVLVKLGLVERIGWAYRHTTLGSIVNDLQLRPLEEGLTEYWNFQAIDEIKKSETIPEHERVKIVQSLLNATAIKKYYDENIIGQQQLAAAVKVIQTYDELVESVFKLIQSARKEIFLASRYYDPNVSRLLMSKFNEGVTLHLIDDNPSGTTLVTRLQAALDNPAIQSVAKAILESPRVRIGESALEYSFIVIDGEHCQFEIVNRLTPGEFNFAIEVNNKQVSLKMISIFEKIMASEKTVIHVAAPIETSVKKPNDYFSNNQPTN